VIFNDRREDGFVAVLHELDSGREQVVPHPLYALSRDGRQGVGVSFSRLNDMRPGYGYVGLEDPWRAENAPADDGIHRLDLVRGTAELVMPLAQIVAEGHTPDMVSRRHWVNHLQFNPDDTRVLFLHRWRRPDERTHQTRLFTMAPDGSELRLVWPAELISHFDWRSPQEILVWARDPEHGTHFYLVNERTGERRLVGNGVLTEDGHCSYRRGGGWIVNDTYPDAARLRTLMIFRERDELRIDLARFYDLELARPGDLARLLRCDLHPRWNRGGTQICIDSAHEGSRQMYVVDVAEVIAAAGE
jgi:hypothetical protein